MVEPGLDLHEWETRWQDLEDAAVDSPVETLPEMARLIEEMLVARGFQLDEPVTAEGEEFEIVKQFLAALEVARLADAGDADPGDVAAAIEGFRAIYEYLVAERAPP
jgi:hypothetical protein